VSKSELPYPSDFVETLANDLARPLMVWRMARNMLDSVSTGQRRGAVKRMRNAERDIIEIVQHLTAEEIEAAALDNRHQRSTL
jgi:hypothetical protein